MTLTLVASVIGAFDTHVTGYNVLVSEDNTFNTYFSIKTNATVRLDLVRLSPTSRGFVQGSGLLNRSSREP